MAEATPTPAAETHLPEGIVPGVQTGENVMKLLQYAKDNGFGEFQAMVEEGCQSNDEMKLSHAA
jgi:hypothetical protein